MRTHLLVLLAFLDAADEVGLEVEKASLVVQQLQRLRDSQVLAAEMEDLFLLGECRLCEMMPALEVNGKLAVRLYDFQVGEGILSDERRDSRREEKILLLPALGLPAEIALLEHLHVDFQDNSEVVLNKGEDLSPDVGRRNAV